MSLKCTPVTYAVEPFNNCINILVEFRTFRELLKETFEFRKFFGLQVDAIKIYSIMFLYQFY